MGDKYAYLCVCTGPFEKEVALSPVSNIHDGDLVFLEDGAQYTVTQVVFVDLKDELYNVLTQFAPVHKITRIYQRTWEESNALEENCF